MIKTQKQVVILNNRNKIRSGYFSMQMTEFVLTSKVYHNSILIHLLNALSYTWKGV